MAIGYACLTVGVFDTQFKTIRKENATDENLTQIIENNLNSLENIIDYNIENNVKLFRISSDLIPFGSSEINKLPWDIIFRERFKKIGEKIKKAQIRVSMHPGQYTILNSPKTEVVKNAIQDLEYHAKVLNLLDTDEKSKIILHIGGVYNEKNSAIKRFIENYRLLAQELKDRIVIENDERSFNICEVLYISEKLDIPVVVDNLHNEINPCNNDDIYYLINEANKTWKEKDGVQKIHYSQQNPSLKQGAHSETIIAKDFLEFYNNLPSKNIDIMLEVKDKNISALKSINITSNENKINALEKEWARYKYKILETSINRYQSIRELLKDKSTYPALQFYTLIEDALKMEITKGNAVNSAQHVWGYFKDLALEKEKEEFLKKLLQYENEQITLKALKNFLFKMALKYKINYLLENYYFYL